MEGIIKILKYMIDVFGTELFFVGSAFMFLHCFFGYQLLRVWSTIVGMVAGAAVGIYFASTMSWSIPLIIATALLAACALGWVFYQIYILGVFAIFAAMGFAAMYFLVPEASNFWLVFMTLSTGLLGIVCVRPLMIVFSAIFGGALGSVFLMTSMGNFDSKRIIIIAVITIIAGMICQFFITAPPKKETVPKEKKVSPMSALEIIPIEEVKPLTIEQNKNLPSSEELDRMIEEQLQSTAFKGITTPTEEVIEEISQNTSELPNISDAIIDEMIVEAIPDAEEYLHPKEVLDAELFKNETIREKYNDFLLDNNAPNDFFMPNKANKIIIDKKDKPSVTDIVNAISANEPKVADDLHKRSMEDIEANIAALEYKNIDGSINKNYKTSHNSSSALDDLRFKLLNEDIVPDNKNK